MCVLLHIWHCMSLKVRIPCRMKRSMLYCICRLTIEISHKDVQERIQRSNKGLVDTEQNKKPKQLMLIWNSQQCESRKRMNTSKTKPLILSQKCLKPE